MKILMTTDNLGGVWRYSLSLAKGLKKFDIEIILAVIGLSLKPDQKKELEGLTYYFFEGKQEWMENPWNDIKEEGTWLLDIACKEKPDLVHLNCYSLGSLKWNVPVVISFHSCVLSWWNAVNNEEAPKDWNAYRNAVKKGLGKADYIIAPSQWMLDTAFSVYRLVNKKKVIYNGLNPQLFYDDYKEDYIFSMGRLWDEAKNIRKIVETASLFNYPVYIAGENTVFEKNIPDNVFFTGYLPAKEISEWLANAAIYLLPVKYEPFGYTFLEAALSGCALITGNIKSMVEIWDDSAIYVDPENEIQIAFEINNLINDNRYRQKLGNNAKTRALEKYTLNKMLHEYANLYKNNISYKKKEIKILAQ